MKKLMSLGCLMALVLAGAPAFAADWFTGTFTNPTGGAWGSFPESWAVKDDVASFNDWSNPAVFTATTPAVTTSSNSIVKTSVQFTALDGSEKVPTTEMEDALKVKEKEEPVKAGLTIVEDANEVKKFYGIVNGAWVELTGDTTAALEGVVPVKIEIMKGTDGNYVQYTVGTQILKLGNAEVLKTATTDISIQSVSYLGNVQALSALVGYAYGNTTEAKEEIAVQETETIPATIAYNPADLAVRNIDVTNPDEIKSYLTSTQSNGNLGWVNSTLGIADDQFVEIASNKCAKGSVELDFGFAQDGNSTIEYVIDTANTNGNAQIDTAKSGIHTVEVQVTQGGKTVSVTNQQVGVMNTGKTLTDEEKTVKGDEKIFDIVAVPFGAFQGQVTVANVLNTAELTDHDMLYVLRKVEVGEGKYEYKYDTYELSGGVWTVVGGIAYGRTKTTANTPEADVAYLEPDQAIWIERNVNSKIVFAGKGEVTENHIWEWDPKFGEYSLVANPTINAFNLQGQTFGVNGDQIIVEDVDNPRKFERKNGVWGQWVTVKRTIRGNDYTTLSFKTEPADGIDFNMVIDAGIGFWYYKADATSENPASLSIDFGTNATPVTPVEE